MLIKTHHLPQASGTIRRFHPENHVSKLPNALKRPTRYPTPHPSQKTQNLTHTPFVQKTTRPAQAEEISRNLELSFSTWKPNQTSSPRKTFLDAGRQQNSSNSSNSSSFCCVVNRRSSSVEARSENNSCCCEKYTDWL